MKKITALFLLSVVTSLAMAESLKAQEIADPGSAFLRSMIVPGWGHYYIDNNDWARGKVHLGAETVMIATFFGLDARAGKLTRQVETFSALKAGVDISGRGRDFRLAIAEFNSLEEYNDFQLRSRNWNRLIDNTPENRWNWNSEEDRRQYRDLRADADRMRNQLPALFGLMVVNRVWSGISAYNRARNRAELPQISLMPLRYGDDTGMKAKISFRF